MAALYIAVGWSSTPFPVSRRDVDARASSQKDPCGPEPCAHCLDAGGKAKGGRSLLSWCTDQVEPMPMGTSIKVIDNPTNSGNRPSSGNRRLESTSDRTAQNDTR